MPNGKKKLNALKEYNAPILSRYIDDMREKEGFTVTEFSKAIGINKDVYRRRLMSEDGFTEKELVAACAELDCGIMIQNTVHGTLATNDRDTGKIHLVGDGASQLRAKLKK